MDNVSNNIESIMRATLNSLQSSIDVNHIVGTPIMAGEDIVIPISKVSFGFVTGGGEYAAQKPKNEDSPYAGGSGAGVTIQPIGFLICNQKSTFIKVDQTVEEDKWVSLAKSALNLVKKQ